MDREGELPGPQAVRPGEGGDQGGFETPEVSISFEDFYEIEQAGLFGALCLITGNGQEAEELTQEAFLKLWERWHDVQSFANPTGYLYRTAMNAFRMRRRRLKVAARRIVHPGWERDAFADVESRHVLDAALRELTPRQRAAVVLTELLGYSASEAARTMRTKPATVRKLASLARARLRGRLEPESGGGDDG
ncbi:MAG: RNA polymerase sigma factor [Actinomycetota bacterium]